MNRTPLEDQVHDALHRRVDPLQHAPFTVTDVRRRARRIQRRRAVAAGAAVAAALAVAVPVGLTMVGGAGPERTVAPPVTQPPAVVTETVRIDPRSASVGDAPRVPLIDGTGPTLTVGNTTVGELPAAYLQVTPYGDGWVAVRSEDDGSRVVEVLTPDLEVEDTVPDASELAVSPDGSRVAWAVHDGDHWTVVDAGSDGAERPRTTVPEGPAGSSVGPVGYVSDTEVLVYQLDELSGTFSYYLAAAGELTPVEGLDHMDSASPVGLVAGLATTDGAACSSVFTAATTLEAPLWSDCNRDVGAFSPDGTLVAAPGAGDPASDGDPHDLAILDARNGRRIVDFEVTGARQRVVGIATQVVWEDGEHLLAVYTDGGQQYVVRLGVDGTVERAAGPVTAEPGTYPLRVTAGRAQG